MLFLSYINDIIFNQLLCDFEVVWSMTLRKDVHVVEMVQGKGH